MSPCRRWDGLGEAVPKQRLEFAYDFQGRRIQKKVFAWDSETSSWRLTSGSSFIYDAWNPIAELQTSNLKSTTNYYVWGLDLSGSLQGAGGVGGLLMVQNASDSTTHFPAFDGNGNVMALVNSDTGAVSAEYEYGPFGEQLRATGAMAKANPFRFSTKCTDQETGLLYYGYRFYNPGLGRWLSRDPMEEEGEINLYMVCANSPLVHFDSDGLITISFESFKQGINDTIDKVKARLDTGVAELGELIASKILSKAHDAAVEMLKNKRNRIRIEKRYKEKAASIGK